MEPYDEEVGERDEFSGRYSITQVSKILDIKETTLRKYQSDYGIMVPRDELGHRYYTDAEVKVFSRIKEFKVKGYSIHQINTLLDRSVDAIEQKEQAMDLMTLDKLTGADFKDLIVTGLAQVVAEREQLLVEQFEQKLEQKLDEAKDTLREELKHELSLHMEHMKGENLKLMDYLEKKREENKKGILGRLFGGKK